MGEGRGPRPLGLPHGLPLATAAKAAGAADEAAAFGFDGAAAVGAGAHGGRGASGWSIWATLARTVAMASAQERTLLPLLPGAGAADAFELLDDGFDGDAAPQGQGDQAAGAFELGGGAAARFAQVGEDLADAGVVG